MSVVRVCACGCRKSLDGRRANALYFDGACRVRAHRARGALTRTQPRGATVVTLTGPATQRSDVRRAA
jgi:prepilin-type processing-associated H-X9-DG protein